MRSLVSTVVVAVALCLAVGTAQSGIAGRWRGEDRGRGGPIPVVLDLTVDGVNVTGTLKDGDAPPTTVGQGRFADDTLTFRTSAAMNGREIVLRWEGQLKGAVLQLVRRLPNDAALPPIELRRE